MNKTEKYAISKGIFIQQSYDYTGTRQIITGYCVTFPRIDDTGKECIFPSETFKTFNKALSFARKYKAMDSRVKTFPIYSLMQSWKKGYCGTRILCLVDIK